MRWTNTTLFESGHPDVAEAATEAGIKPLSPQIHGKINPGRLHTQMFAYTVTNQAINFFLETGLPFILRGVSKARAKSAAKTDEKAHASPVVEQARKESSLPEYTLFGDYSEMVTQVSMGNDVSAHILILISLDMLLFGVLHGLLHPVCTGAIHPE